jgi:hypothetical protein
MNQRQEERYYCIVRKNGEIVFQNLDGTQVNHQKAQCLAEGALKTINETVYVYLAKDPHSELYKIGMSKTPSKRAARLGVRLIHVIPCTRFGSCSARKVERLMHEFFHALYRHVDGEWFQLHGFDVPLICAFSNGEKCVDSLEFILDEIKHNIKDIEFPTPEQFNDVVQIIYGSSIEYCAAVMYSIYIWARRIELAGRPDLAIRLMQLCTNVFYKKWYPDKDAPQLTKAIIPSIS